MFVVVGKDGVVVSLSRLVWFVAYFVCVTLATSWVRHLTSPPHRHRQQIHSYNHPSHVHKRHLHPVHRFGACHR